MLVFVRECNEGWPVHNYLHCSEHEHFFHMDELYLITLCLNGGIFWSVHFTILKKIQVKNKIWALQAQILTSPYTEKCLILKIVNK